MMNKSNDLNELNKRTIYSGDHISNQSKSIKSGSEKTQRQNDDLVKDYDYEIDEEYEKQGEDLYESDEEDEEEEEDDKGAYRTAYGGTENEWERNNIGQVYTIPEEEEDVNSPPYYQQQFDQQKQQQKQLFEHQKQEQLKQQQQQQQQPYVAPQNSYTLSAPSSTVTSCIFISKIFICFTS